MVHTFFITIVLISLNVYKIHGQESALNTTKTTSTTSIKPTTNYSYQTLGFNSSAVTSGPILLIDKKTIFISNLHYDGSDSSAAFWAGKEEPSSKVVLVPDEDNLTGALKAYHGQNIYLQLPGNFTTDKIDYLGIWSRERKLDISHVMLYSHDSDDVREKIPEARGLHRTTVDNQTIFRVPKCCGFNEMYKDRGCHPTNSEPRLEYKVYPSNETHIDPDANMSNIKFIPYPYNLQCSERNYMLILLESAKNDVFGLIFNTSLIYSGDFSGIYSHGQFCMENFIDSQEPKFLICVYYSQIDGATVMPNFYFPLLIISTICFFLSACCYIFILKAKDVHNQCFIGYSSSMTVTFLSLIFLQKLNSGCGFIGSLFIFSTLCSFVWLTCLCTDLIFIVKSYERYSNRTRIYFYIGSSLIIPIIFLMASLIPEGSPDVPSPFMKAMYADNMCVFEDVSIAILFTPIGILILASLISLVYTSYLINTHNDTNDYDWVRNKSQYKFMLRSCFLIWITTCIWLLEVIVHISNLNGIAVQFAIDLVEASQGIFVMFIFVLNKYTRKEILRVLEREKHRREQEMQYSDLLSRLNQTKETNGAAGGARAENEHG